ncbi:hypothetical protein [Chitinophaga vietnamensis]|uniref:hypothetical protein n=1 Tax=Chitinophaga vietnamensis TaxID=2593957 RepID=UPI001178364A|nr:hypothetical protein [Chitinophaga vietnamensis]
MPKYISILLLIYGYTCCHPAESKAQAYSGDIGKNNWKTNELKGRVKTLEISTQYLFAGKSEISKQVLTFDPAGNVVELTSNEKDVPRQTFSYNTKGHMIALSYIRKDTLVEGKCKIRYDRHGNIVERISLTDTPQVTRYNNIYDHNGHLRQVDFMPPFDTSSLEKMISMTLQFDPQGRLSEETICLAGAVFTTTTYYWDNHNRETAHVKLSFHDTTRVENEYDAHGNKITERQGVYSVIINKYVYDAHGNWIRKETYLNDKPNSVIERKLTYF